jgi:hypothetical protein
MTGVPYFRPWGLMNWVLPRITSSGWSFLGGLSTEDRSLGTWSFLASKGLLSKAEFIQVQDPPSRYSTIAQKLIDGLRLKLLTSGVKASDIKPFPLFTRTENLVKFVGDFISTATGDVVLDISSLPKRFFFPVLKLLLNSKSIVNLVVAYTVPETYGVGSLSEDPEPWRHIPLFAPPYPEPEVSYLIVGIGFEPLALPELLQDDYHSVSIKLLFPFPPGPPSFQRTWEFVRNIEANFPHSAREPIRVDARDVSDTFDHIFAATDGAKGYAVLAPYGPKTISLAMCLYSIGTNNPVYYTQPRVYNPFYSKGISTVAGEPETYGYCLRLSSKDLYTL